MNVGSGNQGLKLMEAIADLFNVDMNYLYGRRHDILKIADPIVLAPQEALPSPRALQPMPKMDWVPLVGRIACGTPITAEENVAQMRCRVPSRWHSQLFTLTCEGDSMQPRIHDGDLAGDSQPAGGGAGRNRSGARSGDEATLKHVYLHENFIELRLENPAFESIILTKEEMNTVVIEGKAVGSRRDI